MLVITGEVVEVLENPRETRAGVPYVARSVVVRESAAGSTYDFKVALSGKALESHAPTYGDEVAYEVSVEPYIGTDGRAHFSLKAWRLASVITSSLQSI